MWRFCPKNLEDFFQTVRPHVQLLKYLWGFQTLFYILQTKMLLEDQVFWMKTPTQLKIKFFSFVH